MPTPRTGNFCIKNGCYTHILTSPEIALGEVFRNLLGHTVFYNRLALIAIDEFHIVQEWGTTFRKRYAELQLLRTRVPPQVPWFGTSATLDPVMLQQVIQSAGFQPDVRVIHTDIDRPDLFSRFNSSGVDCARENVPSDLGLSPDWAFMTARTRA